MSERRLIPEPASVAAVRVPTHLGDLWMPESDEVMVPYLRNCGAWEPDEERLLRTLMKPDTRFLDVGANVGYFSLLAARCCPRGTIDAVEPDPRNLALLRLNLFRHAPAATVWPGALGDARGALALETNPHNAGDTRTAPKDERADFLCAVVPGDELFAGRRFDLIKVDVQGAEAAVLRGLRETLRRSDGVRLVVEFYPRAIEFHGQSPAEVLRLYAELGLDRVVCVGERLERMDDASLIALCRNAGPDGYVNLLLRR